MAFLEKTDLKISILINELDEITRGDNTTITEAIDAAVGQCKTYLFDSYDTDAIFSATGSARNQMLLITCVDIAVYRICAACQAGIDLDDKEARFKAAITWLKMVQKQQTYPDLPLREQTKQTHVRWGSKAKRRNSF